MPTNDYKSENCFVEFLSDLSPEEAEKMIDKTIAKINAREYGITLTFTDGSTFEARGGSWDGCSMGAEDFELDVMGG